MAFDVAVKKRGLVDLFVDEAGVAKIVVPAAANKDKKGYALVTKLSPEGEVIFQSTINVTLDNNDY